MSDAAAAVEFLRTVFGATGDAVSHRPAEMRIGDSLVMVSEADEREIFPAFRYVYVEDADTTYQRALGAGAVSVEKPWDTPYGDRRAMVRDMFGNLQIATRYGNRHAVSAVAIEARTCRRRPISLGEDMPFEPLD